MILCIDCGNTRIKWGFHHEGRWLATGAVATSEPWHLKEALAPYPVPSLAVASNVARATVEEEIRAQLPCAVIWNTPNPAQCGVINGYDWPERLGADRWAGLIGARACHKGPCLVVTAGTATTIDVLDRQGRFQGGLILPGLKLMRSSLARNTAQLPADAGHFQSIPTNTLDAITSGTIQATAGAIDRMFQQLEEGDDRLILLSGGGAALVHAHLSGPIREAPLLILEGLAIIGADALRHPDSHHLL